jgi:hypothetical protein
LLAPPRFLGEAVAAEGEGEADRRKQSSWRPVSWSELWRLEGWTGGRVLVRSAPALGEGRVSMPSSSAMAASVKLGSKPDAFRRQGQAW